MYKLSRLGKIEPRSEVIARICNDIGNNSVLSDGVVPGDWLLIMIKQVGGTWVMNGEKSLSIEVEGGGWGVQVIKILTPTLYISLPSCQYLSCLMFYALMRE